MRVHTQLMAASPYQLHYLLFARPCLGTQVSYNHGAGGGSIAILGYAELFEQIASYGIIIAATRSCALGCSNGGEFGEVFAAEQRKVIEWGKAIAARPPQGNHQ